MRGFGPNRPVYVRYYPKTSFVIELFAEVRIAYAQSDVAQHLGYGSGLRLIMLTVIVPLIVLGEYFGWFR